MLYFFRGLTLFCMLNLIPLILFGGSGGMIPVWLVIGILSFGLSFKKWCDFFFKKKWVKIIFGLGITFFVVIESCIVVGGMPLDEETDCDYIIVLGAQVRGNKPSATLAYRLDAAYDYLLEHPDTKAVVSGGQGPDEIMTEASAMKAYLTEKGIDEGRILLEDESHTTRENLINSFEIIDAEKANASIKLVSNRFHILRARMQAKELGRNVGAIGAANYLYLIPNYYFREFFAVVKEIFIYVKVMI